MKRLIQFGMAVAVGCCLSGCDGGGGIGGNSPEAVAKAFAEIRDCKFTEMTKEVEEEQLISMLKAVREKIKGYITSSYYDNFRAAYVSMKSKDDTYQFLDSKTSGNKAVVQYTRKNQTDDTCVIRLMKIDGKWKVAGIEQWDSNEPLEL